MSRAASWRPSWQTIVGLLQQNGLKGIRTHQVRILKVLGRAWSLQSPIYYPMEALTVSQRLYFCKNKFKPWHTWLIIKDGGDFSLSFLTPWLLRRSVGQNWQCSESGQKGPAGGCTVPHYKTYQLTEFSQQQM